MPEFGVSLRRQAIYDLLHRLDYSSLMPRPQHEQANPEVQEFFKEIVVEQIDAIAAAHPEEEIHTYFQDEARFGQKGTITRVWARRGSQPRAVRQTGFTSLYVLAAVCAATGAMSAVIMPTLNTEVVNLFLEQFARELPAGVHAVLIWDGAGFHTSEDVVVPSNVSLIQLPPYSPELNPVENLWHYLRAHHWSNRPYRDYDALQEEAVRSLCAVREDTETIKTVCNPRYLSRAHEIAGKRITPKPDPCRAEAGHAPERGQGAPPPGASKKRPGRRRVGAGDQQVNPHVVKPAEPAERLRR